MKVKEKPDNVSYRTQDEVEKTQRVAVEEDPANEVRPGATHCTWILSSTPPAAQDLLVLHPVGKERGVSGSWETMQSAFPLSPADDGAAPNRVGK